MTKQVKIAAVIVLSTLFLILLGLFMQVPLRQLVAVLVCSSLVSGFLAWFEVRSPSSQEKERDASPSFGQFVKKTWGFPLVATVVILWNVFSQGNIFTAFFCVVLSVLVYTIGFIKTSHQ